MKKTLTGYSLIEVLVAVGILASGLLIVFLGFLQSQRINARNQETAIALNLLESQIDSDAKTRFSDLTNTNPPVQDVSKLANATLTRAIVTDATLSIKTITYTLSWSGTHGSNSVQANYQLTAAGLVNE